MAKPHCENCGEEHPQLREGEGYTVCCNELVCWGNERNKFGVPDDYVVACCWAKAEEKFEALGKKVPDESYRL
jgi:hypothetical protein